jgi:hypothetical protein
MREDQWQTTGQTGDEIKERKNLFELFDNSPIPDGELLENLSLFMNRQTLTRIIFMYDLYSEITNIQGDILEFGTRWGRDLALFINLRGMLEPYNHNRGVVGFDSFEGFPESSITTKDADNVESEAYSTTSGYEDYLQKILKSQESHSPISHKEKFKIVKGDVEETLNEYLDDNPQTVIALAYFDLDLYSPTKTCLELIKDRIPKGGIIGLDELNSDEFPGETEAVQETLGLDEFEIKRRTYNANPSYIVKK